MGKEKYQNQIEKLFNKSPVVSFSSVERIVKEKKNVKQYSKQLIRNLLLKGKIKRIAKGCYSIHNDPLLNVFCFQPAYLGLQDSLSFHGLWEQETIPIVITTEKIRPGLRKTSLGNILIRRIDKKYFFGAEYQKQGDFYAPYSDIEKTFIDMIYFDEKFSDDVLSNIIKAIDKKNLEGYLKKYPERFRNKVKVVLNGKSLKKK
jgi:predicted transcriptional regulator of viral defense system